MAGHSPRQPCARARLQAFGYCGVADLGACLSVSRSWRRDADCEVTWAAVYEHTQRPESGGAANEGALRALIQRPFGGSAVGWRVTVLLEVHEDGTERYATGSVRDYNARADGYLIAYEMEEGRPPMLVWETESMTWSGVLEHNPSVAGRSRFQFLGPPGDCWSERSNANLAQEAPPVTTLLRYGSWKRELKENVRSAPSRMLQRITSHRDEVLFVVFSPCGRYFASCSRDCRTLIFGLSEGEEGPRFDQEAELRHRTAACRAVWWPTEPALLVMTEDVNYEGFHGASTIELWSFCCGDFLDNEGDNAGCIFRMCNQPFDIHTAIINFPQALTEDLDLASLACLFSEDGNQPFDIHTDIIDFPQARTKDLDLESSECFLSGRSITRDGGRNVQWLDVWPGPKHPRFTGGQHSAKPLAQLRVECGMNHLAALQAAPSHKKGKLLALTGSAPQLCDQLVLMDLEKLRRRVYDLSGYSEAPVYDVPLEVVPVAGRVVLSARWSNSGDFIVLNTRPFVEGTGPPLSDRSPSFNKLTRRPVPDLSTSMELLLLDSQTKNCVGTFDGHFAFTTKECPFTIFTEDWSSADFLASGGEDGNVYVWHRRHQRLIRRLCGHTAPVNAVSWNGAGLLASASDDQSIAVWTIP